MPVFIEITDFLSPALDVYARLTENQLINRADPDNAMFIAESPLVIGRALDAGYEPVSVLMEARHRNGAGAEILARLGADVPVFTAPDSVLVRLTGFHLTRGMLCCMRRRALPSAEALCRDARRVAGTSARSSAARRRSAWTPCCSPRPEAILCTAAPRA